MITAVIAAVARHGVGDGSFDALRPDDAMLPRLALERG